MTDLPKSFDPADIDAFIRYAVEHYDIDEQRVYLTGQSCGAIGAWQYLAQHLDEVVDRLDRRFDLLTEGPRTAQPRQRTLRAVVDWSYELLDDDEKRVFERLSAFAGGATLAAARAVCADGDVDPGAVETVLGRLVDREAEREAENTQE